MQIYRVRSIFFNFLQNKRQKGSLDELLIFYTLLDLLLDLLYRISDLLGVSDQVAKKTALIE